MLRNWGEDLKKFENFLRNVNLRKYAHLRAIKTVEQDLPKTLLPLEIYYRYYWDTTDFRDYDEIFEIYWRQKLNPYIYEFIKKYFYGCSLQFVEEGFKARLYRIWISILTQFHFQYLWNALFDEKIISTPELDMIGIDGTVEFGKVKIAIQIKKVSYRREASSRRFTKKHQNLSDFLVEIPYLVVDMDELKSKIENPRVKETTKIKYQNVLDNFNRYFIKLDNGFVIFKDTYLKHIQKVIFTEINMAEKGKKISYDKILML